MLVKKTILITTMNPNWVVHINKVVFNSYHFGYFLRKQFNKKTCFCNSHCSHHCWTQPSPFPLLLNLIGASHHSLGHCLKRNASTLVWTWTKTTIFKTRGLMNVRHFRTHPLIFFCYFHKLCMHVRKILAKIWRINP